MSRRRTNIDGTADGRQDCVSRASWPEAAYRGRLRLTTATARFHRICAVLDCVERGRFPELLHGPNVLSEPHRTSIKFNKPIASHAFRQNSRAATALIHEIKRMFTRHV